MQSIQERCCPHPHQTKFSSATIRTRPVQAGLASASFVLPAPRLQPLHRANAAPAAPTDRRPALVLGPAYLLVLGFVELLHAALGPVAPFLGPAFFGAALLLLFLHAGLCWRRPLRYLPLTLAAVPALRLVLFLGPAGPVLIALAWALPVILAAAVTLRLLRVLPGRNDAAAWAGAVWQSAGDLFGRWTAAFRGRLVRYGFAVLTLPALAMLLAAAAGLLLAHTAELPAGAAGLAGRGEPPSVLWASAAESLVRGIAPRWSEIQAVVLRAEGRSPLRTTATRRPEALLLAGLRAALERPMRELLAGAGPRGAGLGVTAEPERLLLRSDTREPRRVGSIESEPGQTDLWLAWEDQVALILLWDSAGRPATVLRAADDALEHRFVPKPPPQSVSMTEAYPSCPSSGFANPYPRGVCTWYAKDRRPDLPGFWGDLGLAINWPYAAEACGYRVDGLPAAGAVIVFPPGANGAYEGGHVGYVEAVEADGLLISECNVTHDSAGIVEPRWWEAGYSCAYRRIPWTRLSPQVQYIHRWREPAPPPATLAPSVTPIPPHKALMIDG